MSEHLNEFLKESLRTAKFAVENHAANSDETVVVVSRPVASDPIPSECLRLSVQIKDGSLLVRPEGMRSVLQYNQKSNPTFESLCLHLLEKKSKALGSLGLPGITAREQSGDEFYAPQSSSITNQEVPRTPVLDASTTAVAEKDVHSCVCSLLKSLDIVQVGKSHFHYLHDQLASAAKSNTTYPFGELRPIDVYEILAYDIVEESNGVVDIDGTIEAISRAMKARIQSRIPMTEAKPPVCDLEELVSEEPRPLPTYTSLCEALMTAFGSELEVSMKKLVEECSQRRERTEVPQSVISQDSELLSAPQFSNSFTATTPSASTPGSSPSSASREQSGSQRVVSRDAFRSVLFTKLSHRFTPCEATLLTQYALQNQLGIVYGHTYKQSRLGRRSQAAQSGWAGNATRRASAVSRESASSVLAVTASRLESAQSQFPVVASPIQQSASPVSFEIPLHSAPSAEQKEAPEYRTRPTSSSPIHSSSQLPKGLLLAGSSSSQIVCSTARRRRTLPICQATFPAYCSLSMVKLRHGSFESCFCLSH